MKLTSAKEHWSRIRTGINESFKGMTMKKYLLILLISGFLMAGCQEENPISPVDASFQVENSDALYIYVPVTITILGEGEKFVIWPGDETHVWTDTISHNNSGYSTEGKKTFSYNYSAPGNYTIVCFASASGNYGGDFEQVREQMEITVSDSIKSFKTFGFFKPKGDGVIVNDSIFVSVCETEDITDVKARFSLSSTNSTVAVNGIPQVSRVTSNDFTEPLTYTITAYDGSSKDYHVRVEKVTCE